MLISGSDFAKFIGCVRQNIYKLVREGKLNKTDDNKYDLDDNINKQYVLSHGKTLSDIENYVLSISEKKSKKIKIKSNKSEINPEKELKNENNLKYVKKVKIQNIQTNSNFSLPENEIDSYCENITGIPKGMLGMTIKQLVMKYGGVMALDKWSMILTRLFSAQEKDQKIQERQNELIPKEFAEAKLFYYLELLHNRLLEYPDSVIDKIISLALSDKETARIKSYEQMQNDLSNLITDTKNKIETEFENLKNKYQKKDSTDD